MRSVKIRVAMYDLETGRVTATADTRRDMLANTANWVEIPAGVALDDPGAWRVDPVSGTLIEAGRVIGADEIDDQVQALLEATDWTQIADVPLTATQRIEYRSYRAALRDLRDTYAPQINPAFPEIPAKRRRRVMATTAR